MAPGKHIVSAIFEDHSDLAELVTEPGYNYFIRASLDQQVFTRLPGVKLEIVDNAEGKEIVSQLKLAKSNYNE